MLTTQQILSAGIIGGYSALDVLIIRNGDFRPAYEKLAGTVSPYARRVLIEDLDAYYAAFHDESRMPSILDSMPPRAIPPLILTLLHVEMGTPLFLSDALLNDWAKEGLQAVSECSRCGYRMPRSYAACSVCGSNTGEPGIWAKTRGRLAWLN